jgi:hypothetical protein
MEKNSIRRLVMDISPPVLENISLAGERSALTHVKCYPNPIKDAVDLIRSLVIKGLMLVKALRKAHLVRDVDIVA